MNVMHRLSVIVLVFWAELSFAGDIVMTSAQQQNLGIVTSLVQTAKQLNSQLFPAEIVVPVGQVRVVSAPQSGLIDTMQVAVGQNVRKGELLARLSSPELLNMQRDYLQAKQRHQLNEKNYQRDKALFEDGIIAQRRYLESESAFQASAADVAQKKQALKLVGMSEQAVSKLLAPSNMQAGISLVAPMSGQVIEQIPTVGMRVEMSSPIYRIAVLNPLWAEIRVPQEKLSNMHVGSSVKVSHTQATGRIITIVRQINKQDQTIQLRAELTQGIASLSPGQLVEVEISQDKADAGYALPKAALVKSQNKDWVFIRTSKGFHPVEVRMVGTQGDEVVAQAAQLANAQVATSGVSTLKGIWLGIGAE